MPLELRQAAIQILPLVCVKKTHTFATLVVTLPSLFFIESLYVFFIESLYV
ncbi:MAG: hypothetical protein ACR5LF_06375 [Symbiopectobacterium sp.]